MTRKRLLGVLCFHLGWAEAGWLSLARRKFDVSRSHLLRRMLRLDSYVEVDQRQPYMVSLLQLSGCSAQSS